MPAPRALVLSGGLVADGTGAPARRADVLISDGRVRGIAARLDAPGAQVRDVTGRVVAPGFVDIHTHSDLTLLSDPRGLSKVSQGVTTEVVGNCGLGVAPLPAYADRRAIRQAVSYLDLDPGIDWSWGSLDGYLEALEHSGPGVNVATLVGHLVLHASVCGFGERPADSAQLARMSGLLRDALDAGAVGLSTGLAYAPLPYAAEDELLALAAVTAAAGKVFTWHVRSYDEDLLDAVGQAVRVARKAGCRTQISHLCVVGRRNWGLVGRALDLVDAANAEGLSIGVDIYPYVHGNTLLAQLLPAWAQEGGPDAWTARLREPAVRAAISEHWGQRSTTWDEITISWTPRSAPDPDIGRTIQQIAGDRGSTGDDAALDLLAELGTAVLIIAGGRSEGDLRTVLSHPAAVVASDGLSLDPGSVTGAGMPHPRSYGCFPRYLRRYADTASDLSDAVRRCTSAPAARAGLTDRGVLRPGAPADVVVFDPGRISDQATFAQPHQFASGIDLVLVNGTVTVEQGRHTGARAGAVLRTLWNRVACGTICSMEPGITWYDVLGVLPGASAEQVQRQHDSKASLLRPELLAGAPSPVVAAASRAREILGAARRVLADPVSRARYDEAVGIRRSGEGLVRRGGFPSEPGTEPDTGFVVSSAGGELLNGMLALSDWLAPHPGSPKRVAVPDVRGLFFSVCLGITGKLGLRVTTVRLTEHPRPVDGLVVSQSPGPAARARRGSALTLHVWHPSP